VEEWMTEKERKKRADREEANRRYEEWLANFQKTDPLYLLSEELAADPAFSVESYYSMGQTYENWCPDFKGLERRFCKRIVKSGKPYTIDLEWGVELGPVKLVIYKDGKHTEEKFFMEHSTESMRQAFAYAKGLLQ